VAKKRLDQQRNDNVYPIIDLEGFDDRLRPMADLETDNEGVFQPVSFTQHDVEHQIAAEYSQDDRAYAEVAINIAFDHHIFCEEPDTNSEWKKIVRPATRAQMEEYVELEKLVKAVTKTRTLEDKNSEIDILSSGGPLPMEELPSVMSVSDDTETYTHTDRLNEDQLRAHNIVANHLRATLEGRQPPQMLMIVIGPGGTGKSALLNAITTTFEKLQAQHLLKKTAMSGVAASLVGGDDASLARWTTCEVRSPIRRMAR
jgi:hypothetical protein